MARKGKGKGKGKGYKNIMGKDPVVHSQSAKGMKQPQRIPKNLLKFIDKNPDLVATALEKKRPSIPTFSFNQLSKEVKEKVIEKHRQFELEDPIHTDMVSEDMKTSLAEMGLTIEDDSLEWDAGHSQRDDVTFEAFANDIDLKKFDKARPQFRKLMTKKEVDWIDKLKDNGDIEISINKESMGGGSSRMSVSVGILDWDNPLTRKQEDTLDNFERYFHSELQDVRRELLKNAYNHFEDISTDENIIENIKANEYSYLGNGTLV